MRRPALLFALLFALSALLWHNPARAEKVRVTMISSATRVAVGEPFVIEVRVELAGQDVDDLALPDFGKLEVLGKRVSRPISFSFGFGSGGQRAQVNSQIIHGFTLRALEPGTYAIQPAIVTAGGRKYASHALTIEATGAALPQAAGNGAPADDTAQAAPPDGPLSGARFDSDLFLRTVVDKPKPYVGEQVTVTVYLYVRGGLSQNPAITREPTAEGFWVQDLLPMQRSLAPVRQQVQGRSFNVYVLRRFAAFPLRAGALEIGAPTVEIGAGASLFDLLTGPSAPVQRTGVKVKVEAEPLPEPPKRGLVHVGSLALEASLDPPAAKVGDAVTLRVVAKGRGNLKALKLTAPEIEGMEVLAPEIADEVTTDLDVVGGERSFRWLLLPRQPGAFQLPAFAVQVFDPESKTYQEVRSEPLSLKVSGKAEPNVNAAADSSMDDAAKPTQPTGPASFGPVRTQSELTRHPLRLVAQPWFAWAVLLAPLSSAGFLAARSLRRRMQASRSEDPAALSLRTAEAKLREAEAHARLGESARSYAALVTALRAALSARLDEPVGGLTLSALETHCLERGMAAPLVARITAALSGIEHRSFDPSRQDASSLERELSEVRELVRSIARHSPKEAA